MDYSLLEQLGEDGSTAGGSQPARNKAAEKQARQMARRETQARADALIAISISDSSMQPISMHAKLCRRSQAEDLRGNGGEVFGNLLLPPTNVQADAANRIAARATSTRTHSGTRPCVFFQQGKCRYGNTCTFAHVSPNKAVAQHPGTQGGGMAMQGRGRGAPSAKRTDPRLSHDHLLSVNPRDLPFYKTVMCHFWNPQGTCPRGDRCTYAHGDADKRPQYSYTGAPRMPFVKAPAPEQHRAAPDHPGPSHAHHHYAPPGSQRLQFSHQQPTHQQPTHQQPPHQQPPHQQPPHQWPLLPPQDVHGGHTDVQPSHVLPQPQPSSAAAAQDDDEWEPHPSLWNDLLAGPPQQQGDAAAAAPSALPPSTPRPYLSGSPASEPQQKEQQQRRPPSYSPQASEASNMFSAPDNPPAEGMAALDLQSEPPQQPRQQRVKQQPQQDAIAQPRSQPQPSGFSLLASEDDEQELESRDTAAALPQLQPDSAVTQSVDSSTAAESKEGEGKGNRGSLHPPPLPANPESDEDDDPEAAFHCALTLEFMRDPVVCADGHSYEREVIEGWLAKHDTSPLTGLPLVHKELVPNRAVQYAIQALQQ